MYKPSLFFPRTSEEKADRFLSWQRPDKNFFAAGACHILAYLFIEIHSKEKKYKLVYIKPAENYTGNHVYVSDGTWAFDFNGWTLEEELLRITEEEYSKAYPGWKFQKHTLEYDLYTLEDFCKKNYHRMPYQYAYLPWERAYNYIKQFPSSPPESSQ